MTYQETEIPLAGAEDGTSAVDTAGIAVHPHESHESSLETQRTGLLAAPKRTLDIDRRMENWIASNLDMEPSPAPGPRSPWIRLIDGLPGLKHPIPPKRKQKETQASLAGWTRFQVAYRRGITIVRLVDQALVRESDVRELACDLLDLIEAGNHCIVLNFQVVERLASWMVVAVDEARRVCESVSGGGLRICGLPQQLASIFPIVGMTLGHALFSDETSAIDTPWPQPSRPRALPIEILSAMTRTAELPPIRGGAPSETAGAVVPPLPTKPAESNDLTLDGLWLDVHLGGSKGQGVALKGSRFAIGRDPQCQLRLSSPRVSKIHAAIERRRDGIFLLDFGSTNGTVLNGRTVRGNVTLLNEGDRIQIGPMVGTLSVGKPSTSNTPAHEMIVQWLKRDESDPVHGLTEADVPVAAGADPLADGLINHELIQNVLVVSPKVTELESDESIETLALLSARSFRAIGHAAGRGESRMCAALECASDRGLARASSQTGSRRWRAANLPGSPAAPGLAASSSFDSPRRIFCHARRGRSGRLAGNAWSRRAKRLNDESPQSRCGSVAASAWIETSGLLPGAIRRHRRTDHRSRRRDEADHRG